MGKLYLLNTLIVPVNFDLYKKARVRFERVSVTEAREVLGQAKIIVSAIGHEGTARVLSKLLGVDVVVNRISVFFEPGDRGLHFFLKQRLPEGVVLSEEELKKLDYWFVLSYVEEEENDN